MDTISQNQIIGIDVSRDWLDIHCLPDGHRLRIANTARGHEQLAEIAHDRRALVCFEGTGGQEWRLWATLDAAGIATRQLPPAQIKAFAMSRGTRAKRIGLMPNLLLVLWCSGRLPGALYRHKNCAISGP